MNVAAAAVIGDNSRIGRGAWIGPGSVCEANVSIGAGTRLRANVIVCEGVSIGDRGLIHPGVVIGGDGFGIANHEGEWVKVPQLGRVQVGDDLPSACRGQRRPGNATREADHLGPLG